MSTKQNQDKLDKRAAALRENLRKRKPAKKKPAAKDQKELSLSSEALGQKE